MSKNKFTNMLKMKIKENALEYLLAQKGSKGSEIDYSELEMANYLLPLNDKLKIEEKQRLFAIRNRMIEIPNNFGKSEICYCGEQENMLHVYSCKHLNKNEIIHSYEKVFGRKLYEQIEIYRRFEDNLNNRNRLKMKTENTKQNDNFPCDQIDPLNFVQSSIG